MYLCNFFFFKSVANSKLWLYCCFEDRTTRFVGLVCRRHTERYTGYNTQYVPSYIYIIIINPTELRGYGYAPVCVRAALFAFTAAKAQARPRESAQVEWRLCNDTRGNVSIFRDGAAAADAAKHCTFATRRILSCATRTHGRLPWRYRSRVFPG